MTPRHAPEAHLSGWTVYDHPRDRPDCFIARRRIATAGAVVPTADVLTASTLDALREQLPRGLVCLPRHEADDRVIVEVWL